ncbi:uncharacterized protein EI97DRAFT_438129 [Westerdykella ornata]|uniref:UAS domain-containing protein n=1 Tax=Westerdykella ornata TaxID=318751 RepID=A0A6A6JXW6_WESOR|nr:uncharacterized protein EI97DRAFT_438129 [Westerdykella ornata]KAF2280668.1 hypothetical protein EI97DRAFT_438129 [Westerdykella ornata]
MDEDISSFVAITSADPSKAAQYLRLTDNNLEQAIQLFFDSPNLDVGGEPQSGTSNAQNPIQIDSDDERSDNEPRPSGSRARQSTIEDDEAMARRLQEEMYGGAGPEPEVRAPMARTTETLVGPGAYDDDDLDALVADQIAARRRPAGRPGIFNQQQRLTQASVWETAEDPDARRRELATATGGASEANSKSNMLAQMYRPPFEIMFQRSWDQARDEGKEQEKWLLVNIQDPAIFDCQILNRDIWKNEDIKATIRENFVFMQYNKDDPRGQQYNNYYFTARDSQDAYPHIAIVDPRTGERVKVWSGPPVPSPIEFHAELHEFLDRYSLKANARNPVAVRKPEKKKVDVNRMTEEEMLEMALQNSLANCKGPTEEDPDALTKDTSGTGKGKGRAEELVQEEEEMDIDKSASPFAQISDSRPHTEPPASADPKSTTRIKFTSSGQQKVRKFYLNDSVRTIYEWIKSGGWEGKEGMEFDLISQRKNLMQCLDLTIEQAGLKGSVVNVEFAE